MKWSSKHFALSANEGSRILLLFFLDEAKDACFRLRDIQDSEALHDFRVGLRRLRSAWRAYREYLPDISDKIRKRFKKMANRTNSGRDAEVQIPWVKSQMRYLTRNQRLGVGWLLTYLEQNRNEEYSRIRTKVASRFRESESKLRAALVASNVRPRLEPMISGTTFARTTSELIKRGYEDVLALVELVQQLKDVATIHQLRIGMKRLRYLLEPVRVAVPASVEIVKGFRRVQDILGELHDAQVMAAVISRSMALASVNRVERLRNLASREELKGGWAARRELARDECSGLLALISRARKRQDELFEEFEKQWLQGDIRKLLNNVLKIADELSVGEAAKPGAPKIEAEEPKKVQTGRKPRQRRKAIK